MRRTTLLQAAILSAPVVLGACALKAPPTRDEIARQALPNAKVPHSWTAAVSSSSTAGADWLRSFGDPRIDALVAEALAYNGDLNASAARIEYAAAQLAEDYDDLAKAVRHMEDLQIRRLPVMNKSKRMVGILSLGDISHSAPEDLLSECIKSVSAHHH